MRDSAILESTADATAHSPHSHSHSHSSADKKWTPHALIRHAERSHRRLPGIRKVPLRAIAAILFVALMNVVVWIAAAILLVGGTCPWEWMRVNAGQSVALLSVC